jgi:MOSC domain-containing protein YiiM
MNQLGPNVGTVISVNVGQPRLAQWRGQQIRTAIWKYPVRGRVMARHLNLDGDGQADLNGHGGENRAMLVYQVDSYRYWQQLLGDAPYEMGWFGENLTVEGLADTEVCIGDRFRIGDALVEVTQPRVTCYRLGVRTGRAEMPSLLVQHGRPGFYVRVLEEGAIGASDPIELTKHHPAQMSVTSVDQLL